MKNLSGTNLAGMSTSRNRVEDDYYATPPESTRAILAREELAGTIYEPACGQGHISKILKEHYPYSKIYSTDLVDRGYGDKFLDFLEYDFGNFKVDNVITNPPFKYAQEFIEKSLKIANDKVIMFAKIQLLEGKSRYSMFKTTPLKCVYVFSSRQNPLRNGSEVDENGKPWASTMCFAWYVWQQGWNKEPVIKWIE